MSGRNTKEQVHKFFKQLGQRMDAVEVVVRGASNSKGTLANLLAEGGFPESKSQAVKDAFDALHDSISDLLCAIDPEVLLDK